MKEPADGSSPTLPKLPIRPEWARDVGLSDLLHQSIRSMARGKGDYSERMESLGWALLKVPGRSYPTEFQDDVSNIHRMIHSCIVKYPDGHRLLRMNLLKPSQRDKFTDTLLSLYECIVEDRGRLNGAAV